MGRIVNKIAAGSLVLMSRTDYDQLTDERKEEIKPFYDAVQDSVINTRLITEDGGTTIEILMCNTYVEEAGKLLWNGIHDLISPGPMCYIEIHNFDIEGNTIAIDKYLVDALIISVVKDGSDNPQTIKITGSISAELSFDDKVTDA